MVVKGPFLNRFHRRFRRGTLSRKQIFRFTLQVNGTNKLLLETKVVANDASPMVCHPRRKGEGGAQPLFLVSLETFPFPPPPFGQEIISQAERNLVRVARS